MHAQQHTNTRTHTTRTCAHTDTHRCARTHTTPTGILQRRSLILQEAHKNRRVASHEVHADSSRSHAVFTIHVNHRDYPERGGQLTFVDLAGSEKIAQTGVTGKMLQEVSE
jgi:hypothetical protein